MDIKAIEDYLNIESQRYPQPTLDALNYYMERFMLTVPFENISVQNKEKISVDLDYLFNKFIYQHRGGFCYEMNHFFGSYLEAKGFKVFRMSATVHQPNGNYSPKGSHLSLVVLINNGYYIADVGFGDLPLQAFPITSIEATQIVFEKTGQFRAIFETSTTYLLQKLEETTWVTRYKAEFISRDIHDFDKMINYNTSHPESIFVKQLMITKPQNFGRATMSYHHLTLTKRYKKEQFAVTRENYKDFLKTYFNLDVTILPLEK